MYKQHIFKNWRYMQCSCIFVWVFICLCWQLIKKIIYSVNWSCYLLGNIDVWDTQQMPSFHKDWRIINFKFLYWAFKRDLLEPVYQLSQNSILILTQEKLQNCWCRITEDFMDCVRKTFPQARTCPNKHMNADATITSTVILWKD